MNLFASFTVNNILWLLWYNLVLGNPDVLNTNPVSNTLVVYCFPLRKYSILSNILRNIKGVAPAVVYISISTLCVCTYKDCLLPAIYLGINRTTTGPRLIGRRVCCGKRKMQWDGEGNAFFKWSLWWLMAL